MSNFVPKKEYLRGIILHYFIKKNLQLKHTEFLLRLTVIMLCRKQHAEIGLGASKKMILKLKIMNALVHRKSLRTKNWRQYLMKTHVRR